MILTIITILSHQKQSLRRPVFSRISNFSKPNSAFFYPGGLFQAAYLYNTFGRIGTFDQRNESKALLLVRKNSRQFDEKSLFL